MCQKTKQMLCEILSSSSRDLTSLMKLSYLIDLCAVRKLGHQISEFKYIRWDFGPFDQKIYINLNELKKENIIKSHLVYNAHIESVVYDLNEDIECDKSSLKEDEVNLICEVLNELSGYGARMLTEIAYKTAPMVALGATLGGGENQGVELVLK